MVSIFCIYPALAGSLQCVPPPPPWYKLASPFRLDTQTPVAGYFSVFVYFAVSLMRLLSCTLDSPSPLGSIIADPNHGFAVSPFSDHFLASRCHFFRTSHTFGSLARILALFLTLFVLPLSGPGFRKRFSCTPPIQLPLPAFVNGLTLPRVV